MFDYYLDSNDFGDGSYHVDSAGAYTVPTGNALLDSIDAGDGSFYADSLSDGQGSGASVRYYQMMQVQ